MATRTVSTAVYQPNHLIGNRKSQNKREPRVVGI